MTKVTIKTIADLKARIAESYEETSNHQANISEEDYPDTSYGDYNEGYQHDMVSTASRLGTLSWVLNLINELEESQSESDKEVDEVFPTTEEEDDKFFHIFQPDYQCETHWNENDLNYGMLFNAKSFTHNSIEEETPIYLSLTEEDFKLLAGDMIETLKQRSFSQYEMYRTMDKAQWMGNFGLSSKDYDKREKKFNKNLDK